VLKEHDYTSVAGEIMNSFENYSMGYFGRVEAGRGLNKYLKIVDKTPLKKFLVAGKSAGKIGFRKNLDAFEKPETRIYCGLLLKCDQIFIDLSDESYRLGESGVFWDAVGLSKTIVFGNVPKMHRKRINELRITNKGVPQFNWI
jgi:hypothetical protein